MTMHLVGPYLTTTRYNSKRKLNAKQQRALAEHNEWLKKRGVHPSQLAPVRNSVNRIPDYREDQRNTVPLSNAVGNGFKSGVMENLHKEKPEVQKEILAKAKRIAPAYSKGGYQYITPESDLTDIGKKK